MAVDYRRRSDAAYAYNRPAGVWILMGIFLFWGLMNLLIAGAAAGFGGAFDVFPTLRDTAILQAFPDATLIAGLTAVGLIFLVLGLLSILASYGIWKARSWGWALGMVLAVIGLLVFPVGTVLSIVTITYLVTTRPFFRVMDQVTDASEERRRAA